MNGRAGRGTPVGNTARRHRVVRPVRPLVPLVSCAGVLLAWGLVAHNSGAGWVQAVGDVLAGNLGVEACSPPPSSPGAPPVEVVEVPSDATAGLPRGGGAGRHPVAGQTSRPTRPRDVRRPAARRGHAGRGAPDRSPSSPQYRGVFDQVALELATAAPFGLTCGGARPSSSTSPVPCMSDPVWARPLPLPGGRDDTSGGGVLDSSVPIGEPRGVRPYRPGDHRRWVHWPATAHSGELMVREMEGPTAEPVTLEVHLPVDADAAERMAERAMATVVALVDRGASVLLATTETSGPKIGAVGDRRSAGRRLARAVGEVDR